ncbi:hypothetical protein [Moorena sp. SIO3E8]|nr:hypothetical protein [Moorena sp. SIO3E8]
MSGQWSAVSGQLWHRLPACDLTPQVGWNRLEACDLTHKLITDY